MLGGLPKVDGPASCHASTRETSCHSRADTCHQTAEWRMLQPGRCVRHVREWGRTPTSPGSCEPAAWHSAGTPVTFIDQCHCSRRGKWWKLCPVSTTGEPVPVLPICRFSGKTSCPAGGRVKPSGEVAFRSPSLWRNPPALLSHAVTRTKGRSSLGNPPCRPSAVLALDSCTLSEAGAVRHSILCVTSRICTSQPARIVAPGRLPHLPSDHRNDAQP